MEIRVIRKHKNAESTIGELFIDGVFFCYTCEDTDRGLQQNMTLEDIKAKKIHGKTAIPAGRYAVALSMSNRFQKYLPELINVPGYAGVRIHSGNTAEDSDGCLLLGIANPQFTIVQDSRNTVANFMKKLQVVEKKEKIWITIE